MVGFTSSSLFFIIDIVMSAVRGIRSCWWMNALSIRNARSITTSQPWREQNLTSHQTCHQCLKINNITVRPKECCMQSSYYVPQPTVLSCHQPMKLQQQTCFTRQFSTIRYKEHPKEENATCWDKWTPSRLNNIYRLISHHVQRLQKPSVSTCCTRHFSTATHKQAEGDSAQESTKEKVLKGNATESGKEEIRKEEILKESTKEEISQEVPKQNAKEPQNNHDQDYKIFYSLPHMRLVRFLSRMKLYQTAITVILVPCLGTMYVTDSATLGQVTYLSTDGPWTKFQTV